MVEKEQDKSQLHFGNMKCIFLKWSKMILSCIYHIIAVSLINSMDFGCVEELQMRAKILKFTFNVEIIVILSNILGSN